jgi:hypothetical protein
VVRANKPYPKQLSTAVVQSMIETESEMECRVTPTRMPGNIPDTKYNERERTAREERERERGTVLGYYSHAIQLGFVRANEMWSVLIGADGRQVQSKLTRFHWP